MNVLKHDSGWIEVICGPMFSGKTEELIRRLRRAVIARQKVEIFKPVIDNRYSEDHIVSHSEYRILSHAVSTPAEIEQLVGDAQVVGIDEAQFFDETLVALCEKLADEGRRVIIAGLDLDYRAVPFEPMPALLARAEYITKTLAICVRCGNPAGRTQRVIADSRQVIVGAGDIYEARCRNCFEILDEPGD
ncbi:MAG: thymidine kinase [Lentisphaerota bacterium]